VTIKRSYGPDPTTRPDDGPIVADRHYARLIALRHGEGAGTVAVHGDDNRAQRYIGPTVPVDAAPDLLIMEERIFGPLLSVITMAQLSVPFGDVGDSGLGAYQGQHGFDRFSHFRSTSRRPLDASMDFVVAPYPRPS
jgi:aldehyde dehydrogenase (NAD+)